MIKNGPIVVIEDDIDDQYMFKEVFNELKVENEILFFGDGEAALKYLEETNDQPFLILSDINLPKLNGIELRDKVENNERLRLKCIPYLFFTTAGNQAYVVQAYSKSVQGFFTKPTTYKQLVTMMNLIIEYWKLCHSPEVIV